MSHWFFIEFVLTWRGFALLVLVEGAKRRASTLEPRRATRSRVVGDGAGDVPALPAREPKAPGEVDVLLVHEEGLVEVLAGDPHRFERLAARDQCGGADAEHLLLELVLTDVELVLAPVERTAITSDRVARGVDDARLPVPVEVVAKHLARRAAGSRVPLEEGHEPVDVAVSDEEIGVREEDELPLRRRRCLR